MDALKRTNHSSDDIIFEPIERIDSAQALDRDDKSIELFDRQDEGGTRQNPEAPSATIQASELTVHRLTERLCQASGPRSVRRSRVQTAVHEIGHAIVAHRLGVWVDSATMDYEALVEILGRERTCYVAGNCRFRPWVECANGDERPLTRAESATISAAGIAAEALASGKEPLRSWSARASRLRDWTFWTGADNDWSDAIRALSPDGRENASALRAFKGAARLALAILSTKSSSKAFEALVPRLLDGETVVGCDLLDALGSNRVGDPQSPVRGISSEIPWWWTCPRLDDMAA